jgi:hypothetical protein
MQDDVAANSEKGLIFIEAFGLKNTKHQAVLDAESSLTIIPDSSVGAANCSFTPLNHNV